MNVCCNCGTEYLAKHPTRSKYCSNKCKGASRRHLHKQSFTKKCRVCGESFVSARNFQVYCSATCRENYHKEEYPKQYLNAHRDEIRHKRHAHYMQRREKVISEVKANYKRNRERIIAQKSQYKNANRARYNAAARKRYHSNPKTRVEGSIRVLVARSIKDKKRRPWETLVGYSLEQLAAHLQARFLPGMTWENYGTYWHIDHIIPVTAFNFTKATDIDFKRCWALKNLRPLEARDNIRKRDRLDKPFQPSLSF